MDGWKGRSSVVVFATLAAFIACRRPHMKENVWTQTCQDMLPVEKPLYEMNTTCVEIMNSTNITEPKEALKDKCKVHAEKDIYTKIVPGKEPIERAVTCVRFSMDEDSMDDSENYVSTNTTGNDTNECGSEDGANMQSSINGSNRAGSRRQISVPVYSFCYYWMEVGDHEGAFETFGWNGDKNPNLLLLNAIEPSCSRLDDEQPALTGVTYTEMRNRKHDEMKYVDAVFFCCIECNVTRKNEIKGRLLLVYQDLYQHNPTNYLAFSSAEKGAPYCMDERGYYVKRMGTHTCVSIVDVRSGQKAYYYSGPLYYNKIRQWPVKKEIAEKIDNRYTSFPPWSLAPENQRFCSLYYPFVTELRLQKNGKPLFVEDHHCMIIAGKYIYYMQCCCNVNFVDCSLKRDHNIATAYDQTSTDIICAIGEMNSLNKYDFQVVRLALVFEQEPSKFCRSTYKFSNEEGKAKVKIEMGNGFGCDPNQRCRMRSKICPSDLVAYKNVTVECCCNDSDVCNHDTASLKAVDQIEELSEISPCMSPIDFRKIFMKNKFTNAENESEFLCAVHYDYALKKTVHLLFYNNVDAPRGDNDLRQYRIKNHCAFVEARVVEDVPNTCPKDVYSRSDTLIGRIIFMCTCGGVYLPKKKSKTEACDAELSKTIAKKVKKYEHLLPTCYHADVKMKVSKGGAPAGVETYLKTRRIVRSHESFWCFDKLNVSDGIAHWRSGEVSAEEGNIRLQCYQLSVMKGEYLCVPFAAEMICCCKNKYNSTTPCNGRALVENSFINELLPPPWVWAEKVARFELQKCVAGPGLMEECTNNIGCYRARLYNGTEHDKLPSGCISNIDGKLMRKYPYLALCDDTLSDGFADTCFDTGTTLSESNVPVVLCCCNRNPNHCVPGMSFIRKSNAYQKTEL